ncbi:MAG TPA: hypothetical protein VNX68_10395, partial [Nitrosopumilaceae archaeon]|nr:hypothetical protein [Nitrosopumilaceae archaeon]
KEAKPRVEKILIRRGRGKPLDENLTNSKFGLCLDYNYDNPEKSTLPLEAMMVAVLMDIRERLDTLINLQHKKAKGKVEKKTNK